MPVIRKAMVITEIVVERIAVSELGLLEIAVERIGCLVRKRSREFSSSGVGAGCASKVAVPAMAEVAALRNRLIKNSHCVFHRLRCDQRFIRMSELTPMYRIGNILARNNSENYGARPFVFNR